MDTLTCEDLGHDPCGLDPARCAALYVRRSAAKDSERRGGSNRSLREQIEDGERDARRHGLHVVRVFEEREGTGASRHTRKSRPRWIEALAELDEGREFHTIIAGAFDRADRKGADTIANLLSKHAETGRRILAEGMDTSDKAMRLAIINVAEVARMETDRLSARVSRTKRSRRNAGMWVGGTAPWGLRANADRKLEHDPKTYPEARRAAEMLLAGASFNAVAADLNERRVDLPRGKKWGERVTRVDWKTGEDYTSEPQVWTQQAIKRLARSPGWAGLQPIAPRDKATGRYGAQVVHRDGDGNPIVVGEGVITPRERDIIMAYSGERTTLAGGGKSRQGRKPTTSMLGGVIRCIECDGTMVHMGPKSAKHYRCATYHKGGRGACIGSSALGAPTEEYVIARTLIRLATLSRDDDALRMAAKAWALDLDPASMATVRAAEDAVTMASQEVERVRNLAIQGILTMEEAAIVLPRARDALKAAQDDLASLSTVTMTPEHLADLEQAAERWDELTPLGQRRIIEAAVEKVTVRRRVSNERYSAPERVTITWRGGEQLLPTAE